MMAAEVLAFAAAMVPFGVVAFIAQKFIDAREGTP